MKLLVIDGQGGGIGSNLIEGLRRQGPEGAYITAVGTNAVATSTMLRAGADTGATGENAIVWNVSRADLILGPVGIVLANAMLGEITPSVAAAVAGADTEKILIPVAKSSVRIAGLTNQSLSAYIADAILLVNQWAGQAEGQL